MLCCFRKPYGIGGNSVGAVPKYLSMCNLVASVQDIRQCLQSMCSMAVRVVHQVRRTHTENGGCTGPISQTIRREG